MWQPTAPAKKAALKSQARITADEDESESEEGGAEPDADADIPRPSIEESVRKSESPFPNAPTIH